MFRSELALPSFDKTAPLWCDKKPSQMLRAEGFASFSQSYLAHDAQRQYFTFKAQGDLF
jgi:hypothetical protein